MQAPTHQRLLLGALLVAAIAVVAFGSVLRFEFVYDDRWTIVENRSLELPLSRVLAAAAAGTANSEGIPDATRPAMIVSLHVDRRLAGLSPFFFHLHSLGLYGVAAALAALAAYAVSRDELVALLAGLFFALAPVHAEAVAAVNYREDLIAGIGILAPLAWLFWPRTKNSVGIALVVTGCWLWGLLAKESALAFVPLFLSIAFVLREDRNFWRSRELELFVLGATLIVWLNWRLALTLVDDGVPRAVSAAVSTRVLDTCRFTARAVGFALFSFTGSPEYPAPSSAGAAWVLAPVTLAAAVVVLRRNVATRVIAAGLSIAALGPLFASPLVGPINPWADRYLFVAVLGGALIWGAAGATIARALPRAARAPSLVVACVAAAVLCTRSARAWTNERTVWTAAVANAPRSARAWAALSRVERLDGNLGLADRDVARAIELDPDYAPARITRIYNLLARRDTETARREIDRLDRLGQGSQPALARARLCARGSESDAPRCMGGKR